MKRVLYAALFLMFLLHHDFWWWDSTDLLFGFLPISLAWHAVFCLLVSGLWALTLFTAWPAHWESWAEESEEGV